MRAQHCHVGITGLGLASAGHIQAATGMLCCETRTILGSLGRHSLVLTRHMGCWGNSSLAQPPEGSQTGSQTGKNSF